MAMQLSRNSMGLLHCWRSSSSPPSLASLLIEPFSWSTLEESVVEEYVDDEDGDEVEVVVSLLVEVD